MCIGEDRIEIIKGAKGSKELVYRNDSLVEERSYDAGGSLLAERQFGADSLPTETKSYIRDEGRLEKVEARDSSGAIVGSRTYRYDRNGRLLGVSADGSLGAGEAGMVSAGPTPQGSWTHGGSATMVLGYDEAGRVASIRTMKDGKALSVEQRTYDQGGALSSVSTKELAAGSSTELRYDEKGRPIQGRELPAKGPERRSSFAYDESGRLIEELRRVGIHLTSIRRDYADDGSLSGVETRRDGMLILAVRYADDGRTEELYEDGILFVRASFVGGRKVKDEFYADGILTRSRDYN